MELANRLYDLKLKKFLKCLRSSLLPRSISNSAAIGDDFLRIGFIKDTGGNSFEIRLPLIEKPNKRARHTLRQINKARKMENREPLALQDLFPGNIFELMDWRSKVDLLKDRFKHEIKEIYTSRPNRSELPGHAQNFLRYYEKIGRCGLLKLKWQIEKLEVIERENFDHEILQKLEVFEKIDLKKRLAIHKTEAHLKNKRKKIYENLALWLKKNYSHLIWDGNLSLQALAQAVPKISLNSDLVAVKLGNKFRQFAGLSVLRSKLKEHDQLSGKWLSNDKSKERTRKCHLCGTLMERSAEPLVKC